VITIAVLRVGIASAKACTRATDNGTLRSRSERGMLSRVTGLDVESRSWTAAAKRTPKAPPEAAECQVRELGIGR
jgi:hypothetical protein